MCLTLGCACAVIVLAGKPIIDRFGVPESNEQENSTGQQLLNMQPGFQPPRQVAHALPFAGNLKLNMDALMPVVVQPPLLNSTVYSASHADNGWVLANLV